MGGFFFLLSSYRKNKRKQHGKPMTLCEIKQVSPVTQGTGSDTSSR